MNIVLVAACALVDPDGRVLQQAGDHATILTEVLDLDHVTRTREFGKFAVKVDTTAPGVAALNIVSGRNMRSYKKLLFKISDNLSGIADFDTYVDGKWVVSDYDAKSATLRHTINQALPNGEHTFLVVVTDERKNQRDYSIKFNL